MNINQLARNQQLMYKFISRDSSYASQLQTQFSGLSALNNKTSGNQIDTDSLMRQMGISGLEGRTVREMAKYKLEQAAQQSDASVDIGSITPQFTIRAQYTPISDEATAAMQDLAMQDAINSIGNGSSASTEERVALIQEQLKDVDPSKRASAFNTMNKVWESELDRIGEYIKENDPAWNYWGDEFDTSILEKYEPGVNVWV